MDPDSGKFYQETPEMAAAKALPQEWPRFQLGEHFDIGGIKMRLDRVYDDSIRMRLAGVVKGRREKRDRSAKHQPVMQRFCVGQDVTVGQVKMSIVYVGLDSLVLKPYKMEDVSLCNRMILEARRHRHNLGEALRKRAGA